MTELENLRKRAKQLVRQHHAGVYTVAPRIRASHPRFSAMTDREVLAAPFALHDAQQVIATEHGFATWADLKEAAPMTSSTDPAPASPWRAYAQVFVRNAGEAAAWYRDVLGFEVEFTYGDPPFYAQVRRGAAAFNLRHTDEAPWVVEPGSDDLLAVRIDVDDAKALFVEVRDRGADVVQPPRLEPWGQVTFLVRDPDGNLLGFGSAGG